MSALNAIQAGLVVVLLAAYGLRIAALRRAGALRSPARLACVPVAATLILASVLALDGPGRRLLYWHTTERLLIGDVASLLIAIGLASAIGGPQAYALRRSRALARQSPRALLARPATSISRALRALSSPAVALALWAAVFLISQLPGPYDAAMRHDSLRLALNALLIGCGVNMWMALLSRRSRLQGAPGRIAYLLVGRAIGAAVACVAIWSPDVYYPYYLRGDTISSTSPLADQGIAGAIMLGETALTAILLLCWLRAQVGHEPFAEPPPGLTPAADLATPQPSAGALAVDVQT